MRFLTRSPSIWSRPWTAARIMALMPSWLMPRKKPWTVAGGEPRLKTVYLLSSRSAAKRRRVMLLPRGQGRCSLFHFSFGFSPGRRGCATPLEAESRVEPEPTSEQLKTVPAFSVPAFSWTCPA